jgi:hypothetical protein
MIVTMALRPGGGRSPSAEKPPPPPTSLGSPRSTRDGRPRPTPRSASLSVLRWGLLIGGLVIIADLATQVIAQRTPNPDDLGAIYDADEFINYILFSILGIVVVRDTSVFYLGAIAGVLASLIDAVVVALAASLAPPAGGAAPMDEYFAHNLAIGIIFAGLSGITYFFVRRWSGARRVK